MKNNYFDLAFAEQRLVMEQTAIRLSLPVQAVEKDLWVTAVLQIMFGLLISHHRSTLTSMQGVDYTPDVRDRIQLVPPEGCRENWQSDYELMTGAMIYGEKPSFAELMESMRELERRFRERS